MEDLLVIAFEAHNPERDHHRRYEVAVGRDLFGDWTVAFRYGRVGRGCREKRYSAPTADPLKALIRSHLGRRLSAPRRLGCAYHLVSAASAAEAPPSDWLPTDLIVRLGSKRFGSGRPDQNRVT